MPNIIGQTLLNQFRVDAFIASGGMGTVYRVWDLRRNTNLAMKVLHTELADDPSSFRHFQREARALQQLAHPNIVPFYGFFLNDEIAFLLQSYVDGPTLKEILRARQGRPMDGQQALIYLKALCAALGYAHSQGIIHCDVKPGNIMINRGGVVYLTDFGIAHFAESTLTTMAAAGTPAYMAPEQIRGTPVSPATDVYALGVILFELLTGRRPFTGEEATSIKGGPSTGERLRFAHLNLLPPDPLIINPHLPMKIGQVLLRALAKKPAERYPNTLSFFKEACLALGISPDAIPEHAPTGIQPQKSPPIRPVAPVVSLPRESAASSNHRWIWLSIIWGMVALLVTGGITFVLSVIQTTPVIATSPPLIWTLTYTSTSLPIEIEQPTILISTSSPMSTDTPVMPILTLAPSITPSQAITSCPGAPPQHVKINDWVRVCTDVTGENLNVRRNPGENFKIYLKVRTNEHLQVVNGPSCADDASWWKVRIPVGTFVQNPDNTNQRYSTMEYTGWVREGEYNDPDLYFICSEP
jgi:serine/threonine-protein kinase